MTGTVVEILIPPAGTEGLCRRGSLGYNYHEHPGGYRGRFGKCLCLHRQCTGPDDRGLDRTTLIATHSLVSLAAGVPAIFIAITVFTALVFSRSLTLLILAVLSRSVHFLGVLTLYLLRSCLVSDELANSSDPLLNGVALRDLQHEVATSFAIITHTLAIGFVYYAGPVRIISHCLVKVSYSNQTPVSSLYCRYWKKGCLLMRNFLQSARASRLCTSPKPQSIHAVPSWKFSNGNRMAMTFHCLGIISTSKTSPAFFIRSMNDWPRVAGVSSPPSSRRTSFSSLRSTMAASARQTPVK